SSSTAVNKCPDFYVPFGTEYRVSIDNISSYSNAIKNRDKGYVQVGVNVVLSDDYTSDVVYSNYNSSDVITPSDASLSFNNNLPIAGINNSCDSYSYYDFSSNKNVYYDLESTSSLYTNATNGNEIRLTNSQKSSSSINPSKTLCVNVMGDLLSNYSDSSNVSPEYYGPSRNFASLPLYDFNEDGDYSWFSDNVMSFSLNNSFSASAAFPVYGAPAENVYNDIIFFEYQILFLEIFPFALLIVFFSLYIFDKNYVFAIEETKRTWVATRSLLDTELVSYAFKKWKKGETIDFETLEEEMLENRGIDTKLDF
ncbi:MAG: hypothetical protein HRS57_02900, partial [Mycoplasmataceae bacterium]|nr:hypothetical protein [Mycoplasmataceae bacterium]